MSSGGVSKGARKGRKRSKERGVGEQAAAQEQQQAAVVQQKNNNPSTGKKKKKKKKKNKGGGGDGGGGGKEKNGVSVSTVRAHSSNINLTALQALDARIRCIKHTAKHVALYELVDGGWERLPVEGPMFVVERGAAPAHQLVVLNRMSVENHVTTVGRDFVVDTQDQYLFFRDPQGRTLGVWFFDRAEMEAAVVVLNEIVRVERSQPAPDANAAFLQFLQASGIQVGQGADGDGDAGGNGAAAVVEGKKNAKGAGLLLLTKPTTRKDDAKETTPTRGGVEPPSRDDVRAQLQLALADPAVFERLYQKVTKHMPGGGLL